MKDPKTEPNRVIVKWGKIIHVQHHLGFEVLVLPIAFRDRVRGRFWLHFHNTLKIQNKNPKNHEQKKKSLFLLLSASGRERDVNLRDPPPATEEKRKIKVWTLEE
jgi:hypothetical protein